MTGIYDIECPFCGDLIAERDDEVSDEELHEILGDHYATHYLCEKAARDRQKARRGY